MRFLILSFFLAGVSLAQQSGNVPGTSQSEQSIAETAAGVIRNESVLKPSDKDRYLPLVSTSQVGKLRYVYPYPDRPRGADPAWQIEQIEKGHFFLPALDWPQPDYKETQWAGYFYPSFEKLRDYRLPFRLLGSQWEAHLTTDDAYFNLPPDQNPNVVTPDGQILKKVDPFGPTRLWYELGKRLTADNPILAKLQEIYPNPPRIIFDSNNEAGKLRWMEVEESQRYLEKYGKGRSDDFKRKVVAGAWIEKYRALQRGMREGLSNRNWQENVVFTAYAGDTGMGSMGRWPGWINYSLHSAGRPDPSAYIWDGLNVPYYMNTWSTISDYQVLSDQIESMNWVFALEQAYAINPDFWFSLLIWDGDEENKKTGAEPKPTVYREAGQTYDMARYRGWLQYGMWLLRPRVVQIYENWTTPLEKFQEKLENIMQVTEQVHKNKILRAYWQEGKLVPNREQVHPYQSNIPDEIATHARWFLLDANVNPKRPWKLDTEIPVFSLALRLGEAPNRSWLVYAHAPLRAYQNVQISIPEWRTVTVDVPREGAFYEVREKDGSVERITN